MPVSDSDSIFIGIDGGASSTNGACIDGNGTILSRHVGLSSNQNNIGFDEASKNVFNVITELINIANKNSKNKFNLSNVQGLCLSLAGVDRPKDKQLWRKGVSKYFESANNNKNKNEKLPLIEVFNDTVACAMATNASNIEGIVCIVGTGSIVCGFRDNNPNVQYRAGGWGPLLNDLCSGYAIGHNMLRYAGLYYDILKWKENTTLNMENEKGDIYHSEFSPNEQIMAMEKTDCSQHLYECVMKFTGISKFDEIIDWAYKGVDFNSSSNDKGENDKSETSDKSDKSDKKADCTTNDSYQRVASLAQLAIENYDKDNICRRIIDDSIANLIKKLIIVMDQVYPKHQVLKSGKKVNIIRGGSMLTKSKLYQDLFEKQFRYTLGGDSRQAFMKFITPSEDADVGAARYIRNAVHSGQ